MGGRQRGRKGEGGKGDGIRGSRGGRERGVEVGTTSSDYVLRMGFALWELRANSGTGRSRLPHARAPTRLIVAAELAAVVGGRDYPEDRHMAMEIFDASRRCAGGKTGGGGMQGKCLLPRHASGSLLRVDGYVGQ